LAYIRSIGYGSIAGYIKPEDTLGVLESLNEHKKFLKPEHRFVKFLYGKPDEDNKLALYILKGNKTNTSELTGDVITQSTADYNAVGMPVINLKMNEKGAARWEIMTEKAYRDQTQIAIVINNIVFSAPNVTQGAIKGGLTQISGGFTRHETIEFATVLSGSGEISKLNLLIYERHPQ